MRFCTSVNPPPQVVGWAVEACLGGLLAGQGTNADAHAASVVCAAVSGQGLNLHSVYGRTLAPGCRWPYAAWQMTLCRRERQVHIGQRLTAVHAGPRARKAMRVRSTTY
jgi:hypothetical protein